MNLLLSDENCETNGFFQTDDLPADVQSEDVEYDVGMLITVTQSSTLWYHFCFFHNTTRFSSGGKQDRILSGSQMGHTTVT
jgi:hypothetical protein